MAANLFQKGMKKLFFLLAAVVWLGSCGDDYDDSALRGRVDGLEDRIEQLEELCQRMNTNISSLQTLVEALQQNDYVTGVVPVMQGGETVGYTISFTKSEPVTIYHGEKGEQGDKGATPVMGVEEIDGIYYWTVDGKPLTDDDGNRIPASAHDGAPGATPQFKIEGGYWHVSYNDGESWQQLGQATGDKGDPNGRGDRAGKTGDGMSISERLRANREKLAGDRVKADGTIEGNPFAYPGAPGSADAGASGNAGAARPAASKKAPVRISVVTEKKDEAPVEEKEESAPEDAVAYIPAGSIITGTIITGGDFPTGRGSFENPTPTLIRIQKEAILPNRFTSDIRECFLLVGGRGELSSERAKLRGEMLSCVRRDGAVIETKLNSYVVGEDGKEGVKGRLVSKQGQMIARTLVAGFASGMAEAFDYDAVPVIQTDSVSNNTLYQQNWSNDAMKGGFAKGASAALERVADFYMDLAEQMVPVVEVNAGRQVDVVVINGTRLKVTTEPIVKSGTAK